MLIAYESVILQPNGRLMNDNKRHHDMFSQATDLSYIRICIFAMCNIVTMMCYWFRIEILSIEMILSIVCCFISLK